jgi:4-alpha-glucanotransferase
MAQAHVKGLRHLARLHRVQTEYVDVSGRRRHASPEALRGALRALGVPVAGADEVMEARRQRRHALRTRRVEPVVVAWDDAPAGVVLRLPASQTLARLSCLLTLEDGQERAWTTAADDLPARAAVESEGQRIVARWLPLPAGLPPGYHRLRVRCAVEELETLVIAAPSRAYTGPGESPGRLWGLFCPLYALHRRTSWGAGDFSDLQALMEWTQRQRGDLVATLPMLATFFDDDSASVSPYSPASRLFWNEFYLDLARIPELARCEAARAVLESSEFQGEVAALRSEGLIHYGRQMRLKRRVLEPLADWFFAHEAGRSVDFQRFVRASPGVEDYAFFQAAGERYGRRWAVWPEALRGPHRDAEVDGRARRYHLYAQWQADQQLRALSDEARARLLTWYVDYPIGVDARSYDVWSHPEAFASGASVGCPPDPVFTKGQDWGFPPPHPDRQREQGYRYLIATLQCHFRYANALRIDHVMGLHRLYWIPGGQDARDGAYVSYPAEEIYAILSVESHRRQAWLVGENLGTVPPQVDRALSRHAVRGMHVLQNELGLDPRRPLGEVPRAVVASVNTHDMPPFAAFWEGHDIGDRLDLGLLTPTTAAEERDVRAGQRRDLVAFLRRSGWLGTDEDTPEAVLRACWEFLAGSSAHVVLLNAEDSWLETAPQNIPNTRDERPNWRRKTRHTFEDFSRMPAVVAVLGRVAELRRGPTLSAPRVASGAENAAPS